jgi:hypothetical protein
LTIDWTKLKARKQTGEDIQFNDPINDYNSNIDAMCEGPVCKFCNKVTSGGLASHGMFQIVPDVHNKITTRKAQRIAGDAAMQEKRAAREERIDLNQQAALEKRLVTARSSLQQQDIMRISAKLKQLGDSPQKKNCAETEAQLRWHELRAAKLNKVDIRVLLEELETLGDDNEVALLPKN